MQKHTLVTPCAAHLRARKPVSWGYTIAFTQYDVRMTTWWQYVVRTADTDMQKRMADATGISQTAFSRWKTGQNKPEAPHVITFARAYGRPAVEALVAAGILSDRDASEVIEIHRGLDRLSDDELLAEIRQRMKGARYGVASEAESDASSAEDEGEEAVRRSGPEPPGPDEPATAAGRTRRALRRQPAEKRQH